MTGILFSYAIIVVAFVSFERSVMGFSILAALTCAVALMWNISAAS